MDRFNEIQGKFIENGFLITQAQAARLLNITTARISQLIKEKKLEPIEILNVKMIKISEIKKIIKSSYTP